MRFPGGLSDERGFWEALRAQKDLVTEVGGSRWPVEELQHPDATEPGHSLTFRAGVLPEIDRFDAGFFGISPREAAFMDPQQRLLLELTWEALEDAGIPASRIRGTDASVFVGISGVDYGMRALDDLAVMGAHSMTGNTLSIAANRISFSFDLHGPSFAVDTACSSSLVALHQACNSLRLGESSLAVVGGVNLLLHPYPFVGFSKASMLSPEGLCRVFDAEGQGYVRSEGAAVLLLKRLEDAEADGDRIHAVICGSGVNADGARKTGLTIPSVDGQVELMSRVLRESGIDPGEVAYLEAHGTGTPVGDPVEAEAIGRVYGQAREDGPLPIGSVKANLGHLEPASGMAGLIKSVLVLKHREIPPQLHLDRLNPNIDFEALGLAPVQEERHLSSSARPVIGVNSFGFGGANAHVLLQAPPIPRRPAQAAPEVVPPLVLSARSDASLKALASRYARLIRHAPERYYDIAYNACFRRERLPRRLLVQGAEPLEIAAALERVAEGDAVPGAVVEQGLAETGRLGFVYSGNGAQWHAMARTLLDESPRFAEWMARLDRLIEAKAGFSVIEELQSEPEASRLAETEVAQPVLFAIQVALSEVLRAEGVVPDAVCGHSVGEVAAAWMAGMLDLEQAVEVICQRSAAQGLVRGSGRMAAVALSPKSLEVLIEERFPDLEIAGINSAGNCTVAGKDDVILELANDLESKGIFCRVLDLDYAFHSRHMEPIQGALMASLADFAPAPGSELAFYSTVTGERHMGPLDADYWWRNVRQPVRFADAVDRMLESGCRILVEISPHPILRHYLKEGFESQGLEGRVLSVMSRENEGIEPVATAVGQILALDEQRLASRFPKPGAWIDLPRYAWDRSSHWLPQTSEALGLFDRRREHPLLGWRVRGIDPAWENTLDPHSCAWLGDHVVDGSVVMPGAAYAEMALAAATLWKGAAEAIGFEDLEIVSPMVFEEGRSRQLRFEINARDGGFRCLSRPRLADEEWQLHVVGRLPGDIPAQRPPVPDWLPTSTPDTLDASAHYALTEQVSLEYGPAFRGFREGRRWVAEGVLEGLLDLSPATETAFADCLLSPGLLDACFQGLIDFFEAQIQKGEGMPFVPTRVGRLRLWRSHASAERFRVKLHRRGLRSLRADILMLDGQGQVIAWLEDCRFRAVPVYQPGRLPPALWENQAHLRPLDVTQRQGAVPTTAEMAAVIASSQKAGEDANGERLVSEYLPLLEGLTLALLGRAFQQFKVDDPEAFRRYCEAPDAMNPSCRELFVWASGRLQEERLLRREADGWVLDARDIPPATSVCEVILREYPASAAELSLLGLVGEHLADLFQGRTSREQLVQWMRSSPHWALLHDSAPLSRQTLAQLTRLVRQVGESLPSGRRLRVLEIGSGNPGLAQRVMDMDFPLDYVLLGVTDSEPVSQRELPGYCRQGRWPDIGVAPELPAGSPGRFDLVIVRNVAPLLGRDDAALLHLRALLAEGGALVLTDRFPDDATRLLDHLLQPDQADACNETLELAAREPAFWRDSLPHLGFEGLEGVQQDSDYALGAWFVMARSSSRPVPVEAPQEPSTWCLSTAAGDENPLADAVARTLPERRQTVIRMVGADGSQVADLPETMDALVWFAGEATEAPNEADAASLLRLAHALADGGGKPPRLWMVTRGGGAVAGLSKAGPSERNRAGHGVVWGLGRVIMNELPELSATLVDLAPELDVSEAASLLVEEMLHNDGANEILLSAKGRHVVQMAAAKNPEIDETARATSRFRLDFYIPGQLKNLVWLKQEEQEPGPGEVEVEVVATGVNFRDVMYAMGMLPDEAVEKGFAGASLGLEFSGRVTRIGEGGSRFQQGDAVMGFGSACFASHVITREDALALRPAEWSFEQAATVPTVFFTVYYALQHLARLQPGERVLIHGAAGGVGIAAIQLARHLGAEIHATAGSEEKRAFVRLLGADHVYDSRSLDFADQILDNTGGEGVDVVLNSLAGEAIRRNLRILRPFGRFLELGKRDFFENTPIGLRPFKDNISYFGIDADQLLVSRPELAGRLFRELMDLFEEGVLYPLPYEAHEASRVVDAFRTMQQARHIGKLVVRMNGSKLAVQQPRGEAATPRLRSDGAYLVTGGLSGFGREVAGWLARHGAGELILVGRRGMDTPDAEETVAALEGLGPRVTVKACDVSDREAVEQLIASVTRDSLPLAGVLHAAMVIDDGLIAQLDQERLHRVLAPKAWGAWYLHQATRDLSLDRFVLFSSITTLLGNPGQANYVAANAYLDALAVVRRIQGLPALCIGWGPIGDAGYLTRNTAVKAHLEAHLGAPPLSAERALGMLEKQWDADVAMIGVADMSWSTLAPYLGASGTVRFERMRDLGDDARGEGETDLRQQLAGKSDEEIRELIQALIMREIAEILDLPREQIDPARPLREMGLDSLMGAELVVALEAEVGVRLPMMLLSQSPSVDQIVEYLVGHLTSDGETEAADAPELDDMIATLASQHAVDEDTQGPEGLEDQVRQALHQGHERKAAQ